ncbi:MAG: hypothetical protein HY805_02915 [Nitrospirae bacterium]|nr:hypothetical protein [Nitrospirota bacterium]
MQSNKVQIIGQLEEFVKKSEKLGKYPSSTAMSMLSVLKIVAEGLTDDEPSDLDYITEHLEEIFHRQMNHLQLSQASLGTYISRVRRIISDFKTYGQNIKAFHAWKPKLVQRVAKRTQSEALSTVPSMPLPQQISSTQKNMRTLVWSLRPDLVIQIQLPVDLNKNDVTRLKKLLDLEVELTPSKEDETGG